MTKTRELAKQNANKMCCMTEDERIIAKLAFEFGSDSMLERACEWIQKEVLEDYEGVIWSDIVKDFRKAMEE